MALYGLIAQKIGMTRVVSPEGDLVPVTLLQVTDQKVCKVLTNDRDGYQGFQLGFKQNKPHRINKPDLGRLKKAGIEETFTMFHEFRVPEGLEVPALGAKLGVEILEGIDMVDIAGITKGHGFEGAPSRHGAATGRETHGSRHHRRPGSLGMRSIPGRVFKGKKMPGHMGDVQRTIQNLKVIELHSDLSIVAIKGSVPGHKNGFVFIKPAIKQAHKTQKV